MDGTSEYNKTAIDNKTDSGLKPIWDCNTAIPATSRIEFYSTSYQASHAPAGSNYWYILAFRSYFETDFIQQIAIPLSAGTIQRRYSSTSGSSWSNWTEL